MGKHSRLSNIFKLMKQRCYDANRKDFCNYGARGITVCDEWNDRTLVANIGTRGRCSKGYLAFKEWALCNGYKESLTIDRIDVNKGYSPENCRWVTTKVQNNNKTNNRLVSYNGRTQNVKQWCDELKLDYRITMRRLYEYHWSVKDAFEYEKGE